MFFARVTVRPYVSRVVAIDLRAQYCCRAKLRESSTNHSPARARSTVQLLTTIRRIIGDRVGWTRIGFVFNIIVVTIALAVLCNLLRNIELHKVAVAIRAMPIQAIALAGVFVAAGYLSLTL